MANELPGGESVTGQDELPYSYGNSFSFSEVLARLKVGDRVSRLGWNGKGMYIELQTPDQNSKMTIPYIYMSTVLGDLVPWVASHTDLLADDWVINFK